jgi:amino acid adenylation domain-containing protein
VVALIAVWRAGGVYVPVDPGLPAERQARMIADSGALVVLCRSDTKALALATAGTARVIDLDEQNDLSGVAPDRAIDMPICEDDAAYIMYTSGSTGRPKGVVIEHRNLNHLATVLRNYPGISKASRALLFSSPSFDASIFEFVMALENHAALVVVPHDAKRGFSVFELIDTFGVTTATLPPTLLENISVARPASLKVLISAGSALRADVARKWTGPWRFINAYGPTEGTVIATACQVVSGDGSAPPIGWPVPGARVYLLDEAGQRVPRGEEGELYIGGGGVARGYLNDEQLTNERFVPDPFAGAAGARMYRTGDRAAELSDGRLEFRGRADRQVQVRGFRVELGEIEQSMERLDGVRQAAVVAEFDELNAVRRLIGFAVMAPGADVRAVRHALAGQLPEYMLPDAVEQISHVPVTHAGKRDERALLDIHQARTSQSAPSTRDRARTESAVREIWCDVLATDTAGPGDDFFALGGDSLSALALLSRLLELGWNIAFEELHANSTVEQLVAYIGQNVSERPTGSATVEDVMSLSTPQRLGPQQEQVWIEESVTPGPAYVAQCAYTFAERLDTEGLRRALEQLVGRYQVLRLSFHMAPNGPVQIESLAHPVLHVVELDDKGMAINDGGKSMRDIAKEIAQRGISLTNPPLVNWTLFNRPDDLSTLLQSEHHLIHDGISSDILITDLVQTYERETARRSGASVPPLTAWTAPPYEDYLRRSHADREFYDEWAARLLSDLSDVPMPNSIPTDFPRSNRRSGDGAAIDRYLDCDMVSAVKRRAAASNCTPYAITALALAKALSVFNGNTTQSIGCPLANRRTATEWGIAGFMINVLPLRIDLRSGRDDAELLAHVAEHLAKLQSVSGLPLAELIRRSGRRYGNISISPYYQVLLSEIELSPKLRLNSRAVTAEVLNNGGSKADLVVISFRERVNGEERWRVNFEYDSALYVERTIARFGDRFVEMLAAATPND